MLLMHKIWTEYPKGVKYLKTVSALVHSEPMKTWKDFFRQRIRWASKARAYNDRRILPVLALVYAVNFSFLILVISGLYNPHYWIVAGIGWIAKTVVELPFFISVSRFYHKQWAIRWFFLFQPLHIFYTIIAGFFGQFRTYKWKGRKVR